MTEALALAALLHLAAPADAPVRTGAPACTPAPQAAIAEAERRAADLAFKADQAESTSVRSGNPGAARRAQAARHEAGEAAREAARLACRPAPEAAKAGAGRPGY